MPLSEPNLKQQSRSQPEKKARSAKFPAAATNRVTIEKVNLEFDGGKYPAKCCIGDSVEVRADIYADGHEVISARLSHRKKGTTRWKEEPMVHSVNDRWSGSFEVTELGRYQFTLSAWVDDFLSWQKDLGKRVDAGQDVSGELMEGAAIVKRTAQRARGTKRKQLESFASDLAAGDSEAEHRVSLALSTELAQRCAEFSDRSRATRYERVLEIVVDPERARFGAWYEMFPRSAAAEEDRHGTFRDLEQHLPRIAAMGFDVLYLPPIHPIGSSFRKGPNNSLQSKAGDPGSPWAIGSEAGGHKAIHPELGSEEDFEHLVEAAQEFGIEIAQDIAFQCSPDHPYVQEHPEWFKHRADGTIKYAENPPKKYQDIYPLDFSCDDWQALWLECRDVFRFWIDRGVRIFRVDNPHTKPYRFWEWLIDDIKAQYPEVIFLSEAFTRPKIMYHLALSGFTQSYTYFTWRNSKQELTEYFTELTQTDVRHYMRPNLFANTPDILHAYLQNGGKPAFKVRLVLAATLGASYGIYGPPFELCVARSKDATEEYYNSEKYQIRNWDFESPDNISPLISKVNKIRRENPALHRNDSLQFHPVDNEQLICFSKHTEDLRNILIVAVNLDPRWTQSGWVELPIESFGLDHNASFEVRDLLNDAVYLWQGRTNFVMLDPTVCPAHIFQLQLRHS